MLQLGRYPQPHPTSAVTERGEDEKEREGDGSEDAGAVKLLSRSKRTSGFRVMARDDLVGEAEFVLDGERHEDHRGYELQ